MKIEQPLMTLKEFIEDRERLDDIEDGIEVKYRDDVFIILWR